MRSAGPVILEFSREENQRRADQAGAPQQPETIEESQERSLLGDDLRYLRLRVQRGIRRRKTVCRKITTHRGE